MWYPGSGVELDCMIPVLCRLSYFDCYVIEQDYRYKKIRTFAIWESDKNIRKHHTQESREASPFLCLVFQHFELLKSRSSNAFTHNLIKMR